MSKFAKTIVGLFIVSLILWYGSYVSYDKNIYALIKPIAFIWLGIAVAVCAVNTTHFNKHKAVILNMVNWCLTLLMLVLFYQYIKGATYSFNALPSFAYIASFIFIFQEFSKGEHTNSAPQAQPLQSAIPQAQRQEPQATTITDSNSLVGKIVKVESGYILVLDNQQNIHEFSMDQWQEGFEPQVGFLVNFIDNEWVQFQFKDSVSANDKVIEKNSIHNNAKQVVNSNDEQVVNSNTKQKMSDIYEYEYEYDYDYDDDEDYEDDWDATIPWIAGVIFAVFIPMMIIGYKNSSDNSSYANSEYVEEQYSPEEVAENYSEEPYYPEIENSNSTETEWASEEAKEEPAEEASEQVSIDPTSVSITTDEQGQLKFLNVTAQNADIAHEIKNQIESVFGTSLKDSEISIDPNVQGLSVDYQTLGKVFALMKGLPNATLWIYGKDVNFGTSEYTNKNKELVNEIQNILPDFSVDYYSEDAC